MHITFFFAKSHSMSAGKPCLILLITFARMLPNKAECWVHTTRVMEEWTPHPKPGLEVLMWHSADTYAEQSVIFCDASLVRRYYAAEFARHIRAPVRDVSALALVMLRDVDGSTRINRDISTPLHALKCFPGLFPNGNRSRAEFWHSAIHDG